MDDVFIQMQTGYHPKTRKEVSVLKVWDIKNSKEWTMEIAPPRQYMLPWAFLALGERGELLVVQETGQTDEAGDQAVWVTEVDIQSATKGESEFAVRAPWLGTDAWAVLLRPAWQSPPIPRPSGASIGVEDVGGLLSHDIPRHLRSRFGAFLPQSIRRGAPRDDVLAHRFAAEVTHLAVENALDEVSVALGRASAGDE